MSASTDDPGAPEVRPTDDVDLVVELATESERIGLDERLRAAGLQHDVEGPICRWRLDELKVDIMPARGDILGFSNTWYPEALAGAWQIQVEDLVILIPHVCTFLATKVEAFMNRGKGDFIASSDFEDIMRVLNGHSALGEHIQTAHVKVLSFLSQTFGGWISNRNFRDAVTAHLLDDLLQGRSRVVYERIHMLIESGNA